MKYAVILFFIFILYPAEFLILAGEPGSSYISSDVIIQRANELHDSGNYQASIALLNKVLPVDPNYTWACYEQALNYYYSDNLEMALSKCKEAEFLKYDHPYLYSLMGSILDDMDRSYEGIAIMMKAYKKWPYNQNIMYNLGLCYLNSGFPDSAATILEKSIVFYPYHTRSHLALAKANYAMGRIAESYLASIMAIILSPNSSNILEFENAIGGKSGYTPRLHAYPYPKDYNHRPMDDLRYLLQSELAFNKSFEFPYAMDYTFTRQAYLLFSNLKIARNDTTVYGRLYGGLFSEMMDKDYFETFLYYCMNNIGNAAALDWKNKNQDKIDQFVSWAQAFIDNGRLYGYHKDLETSGIKIHHFSDGMLNSIGRKTGSDELRNGDFIVISSEGNISEKGTYVNDLTEGEWIVFWPNGNMRQQLYFKQDKINGNIQTYHANGAISYKYPFTDGQKNGLTEEYTASGFLANKNTYVNGVLNGPGYYCNFSDAFTREFNYISDTLNGTTKEKWIDGPLKQEYNLRNGLYDGVYQSWYYCGNRESVYNYSKDIKTGAWAKYHFNGMLSDSGTYNEEGQLTGELQSWDESGKLTLLEKTYNSGLLNGESVTYFDNGQERVKQTFVNDTVKSIMSFDKEGNLMYKADAENGRIYYKQFYEDGILKAEGWLNNGKNEGLWKNYNPLGILQSEYRYKSDMLDGLQKTFYENGQVKEEYFCDSSYIIGEYISYFINGHVQTKGFYSRDGREGPWTSFYENDTVQSVYFYTKGNLSGRSIEFNPDGTKDSEDFFNEASQAIRTIWYNSNGDIRTDLNYEYGNHVFTLYYKNGNIRSVSRISDNMRHGIQEHYYPNGQLSYKLNYLHGKAHGEVKQYDYKGNLNEEYNYVYGNLDGKYLVYNEGKIDYASDYKNGNSTCTAYDYYEYNGKLYREMSIVNNERHGISNYYAPDGSFMYRLRFANNCVKAISWKKIDGSFTPEEKIDSSTKQLIAYYPNGKISAKISLNNGLYNGKMMTYYPGGSPLSESDFKDDFLTGVRKEYYPDGKIREVVSWSNNTRNGPCTLYHPNGAKAREGNYLNDMQHGLWHFYDDKGKEIQVLHYEYDDLYDIENK